ncbi:hypothetical protein YTPLAS73_09600 [Nitrosarchaeum sp.]|nr:hypothetical protein YTPLAS73_09600 [Nitrosarchaeum sp.]
MAKPVSIEIPTSRCRTLKHLRKRPQFRRKATSDRRKIYALDIEATSNGKMLLLADNDGNFIDLEDTTLEKTLRFLFHKRYESSWCFFWNLHYDARIILKMILMNLSNKELLHFKQRFRCKLLGYSIHYIEEKKLSIRKGKHSVTFFDISQFYFQKKLSEAYQKNIGKLPQEYLEMKNLRKDFTIPYYKRHKKLIRNYCISDCKFTAILATHWIDMFYKAFGFYPSHWISSGYLAEKILINKGVILPKFDEIPEQAQELAWNAYAGGRIELVQRGYNKSCFIYDVNSAYPYALTLVPELTKGKWIQSKTIQKDVVIGFFKIKAKIPLAQHISPFPFKIRSKLIYPVGEFITFVTLAELQSCEDSSWYEILDSWQYCDPDPYFPYKKPITEMYEQRQALKRAGNPLEQPFKIILNSIYGKTGQTTDNKMGNIFNPVIVSTITGIARAKLYSCIIKHGIENDIIMMYTDSICSKKKLNLDSKELGEFSFDFEGSIYALQSGFYSKNDVWERSRGIGSIGDESINHKETIIDSKGRIKYTFEKLRVGTLKENLNKGTLENIGSFYTSSKQLNINGDRGRLWHGRLTDVRLKEHNISSPFPLPLFDAAKI